MRFYIYIDVFGQWRWHLRTASDRLLAAATEGYNDEDSCLAAIAQVKQCAAAQVLRS